MKFDGRRHCKVFSGFQHADDTDNPSWVRGSEAPTANLISTPVFQKLVAKVPYQTFGEIQRKIDQCLDESGLGATRQVSKWNVEDTRFRPGTHHSLVYSKNSRAEIGTLEFTTSKGNGSPQSARTKGTAKKPSHQHPRNRPKKCLLKADF